MAVTPNQNHYVISFKCANCGNVFEKAINKGLVARGNGGICPNCGIKDRHPGVGAFQVVSNLEDSTPKVDIPPRIPPRY